MLRRRSAQRARRAVAVGIAGELHDVVAHALSAMTVQATGARRLTLTRPELARDAFAAIETAGREALDELRRLLGVLRATKLRRRRAAADRARAARPRRALDQRDGRPGRRRAADPRPRPRAARWRRRRGSSAPAARRWPRCATCSAMLRDGAEPPALAPQPTLAEIGELVARARARRAARRRSTSAASAARCPPGSTSPRTGSSRRR